LEDRSVGRVPFELLEGDRERRLKIVCSGRESEVCAGYHGATTPELGVGKKWLWGRPGEAMAELDLVATPDIDKHGVGRLWCWPSGESSGGEP
jgi:hypothetical protein